MKFKITATIITTQTLTKTVSASTLTEATAKMLIEAKGNEWKVDKKLKTTTS